MMPNDEPPRPTLAELMAALARSRDDVAAGRIVPGETVMAGLDACLAEMEGQQARKATDAA
jgi:hypothetical protein